MKKITLLFLLLSTIVCSQKKRSTKIGKVKSSEVKMSVYEKDSTANAVVLYEHANVYLDEKNDLDYRTDYYHKIKLIRKESFDRATVKVLLANKERVLGVKALSYTLNEGGAVKKTYVSGRDVFKKKLNEYWTEVTFTIPNIKEGTVIEYVYSIVSPYSSIDDWYFQSDIPKVKSDFTAAILGNYEYNVAIVGFLTLDRNSAKVKKGCVNIPGVGEGSCSLLTYGMDDIPAFKEEDYMLSKENFISKITFELSSVTNTDRTVKRFTKKWRDADKTLRLRLLDSQTSKRSFFKKQIPEAILNENSDHDRAKKIFKFIQNHFNWNSRYFSSKKINLKKSFAEKTGSVDVINLALYNSLQAAGIKSYPVVLSTRSNGIPPDLFPVVSIFNYVIVKAEIGGKTYFLDATDKYLAYGQVDFQCLNGKVRVLDFDKGSYWEDLSANQASISSTKLNLTLNSENAFVGTMETTYTGYSASNKREELSEKTKEQYLESIETQNPYLEIGDYAAIDKDDLDSPLKEKFEVEFFDDSNEKKYHRINPFFDNRISENPFKLKERSYPVDFGVPFSYSYRLELKIPLSYEVVNIPRDIEVSLPNNSGVLVLKAKKSESKVDIYLRYMFNQSEYNSFEYQKLKDLFNKIIEAQNSYIEIKPIN
tara:strand:+ start:14999 stop:16948 length:1950 start_codon:yes stop_codon:yes gene_type:complete